MKKEVKKKKIYNFKKINVFSFWQKLKNIEEKHKAIFFLIFIIVIFIVFGTRLYLLFNFLLGNDTLVTLTASNQDFFLKNLETGQVEFDVYVSANLFCEATCEYVFEDLSSGYILDKNNFTTKISNPNKLVYSLVAPEIGEGQKLYKFEIGCFSQAKGFCNTKEKVNKRSYLVALNYELNDEQKLFRDKANESLQKLIFDYDELRRINLENQEMFYILSEYIFVNESLENNLSSIGQELDFLIEEWKNYEYEIVLEDILFEELNSTRDAFVNINENLSYKFDFYNEFVLKLIQTREEILNITFEKNVSLEDYEKISMSISDYNNLIDFLKIPFDLESNNFKISSLIFKIDNIFENLNKSFSFDYNYTNLSFTNLTLISKPFRSNYSSGKEIQIEKPMCCYRGDCDVCCGDNCRSDPSKYPIILVHGHSFNDKISADSSLGDLNSIKDALVGDGIIDGGYVIMRKLESTGTFAKTNRQIVFATSYYFDIYQNDEETLSLQTKADSLDTYALRLNDIIENVKLMTNRDKVIIVSHSMGGLVSRRYIQIFGDDSVENLIMIGTPNHGIEGYVLSSCPVFGANIHCDMMDEKSLFLNKLNFGEIPDIPVSMIIGLGCSTGGGIGDGIVKNESAYLPWAKNYFVYGSCSGVDFFHQSMLDVTRYSEVYEIIRDELGIDEN
jgi:hypothetical protein